VLLGDAGGATGEGGLGLHLLEAANRIDGI